MLIVKDRVIETSTSTGTGDVTLAGAFTGFLAFSSVCSVGDTCYYLIEAVDGSGIPTGEWESGLGTYSAANTLTRTTVSASSNSNAAVSFSVGTKRVSISAIASQIAGMSRRLYSGFANVGTPANTTETTLQTYTLPGGTLAVDGQAVRVTVRGKFAATTRLRTLRVYFGSTVVFVNSTTNVAYNITDDMVIMRTGATTQVLSSPMDAGTSTVTIAGRFIEFFDPTETLASDIVIKVTGQSAAGAVANDITCDLMLVELLA